MAGQIKMLFVVNTRRGPWNVALDDRGLGCQKQFHKVESIIEIHPLSITTIFWMQV